MKNTIFKLFSLVLSVALCFSSTIAFAQTSVDDEIYIEYYNQINFTDIDYAVSNSNKLLFSVDNNKNLFKRTKAKNNIETLYQYFEEHKNAEQDLIEELTKTDSTIMAIAYTIAPVVLVDDHYERVLKTDVQNSSAKISGQLSSQGNFTMQTTITKTTTKNSAGEYAYNTLTSGYWSEMSAKGGADYPASGDDYILQSVPNNMKITSDSLVAFYHYYIGSFDNYFGRNGKEYSRVGGNDYYVEYRFEDDPLGLNQVESVKLHTTTYGKPSSNTRKINSYYVHTWKTMDLSATISASTSNEVQLSITPSAKSKYWKLYSYVAFNF